MTMILILIFSHFSSIGVDFILGEIKDVHEEVIVDALHNYNQPKKIYMMGG